MREQKKNDRIIFLDWLRIIACIGVLIGHKFYDDLAVLTNNPQIPGFLKEILKFILPLFYQGGACVVIFFLVSGYIITHVLIADSSFSFVIKRAFRIYPLYVVALVLQCTLNAQAWSLESVQTLFIQISLLGDFFKVPCALGGVEWTLRIEILFYLIMAGFKYFGLYRPVNKIWFTATVVGILILLVLMPPFPNDLGWRHGYYNQFIPFLLLGSTYCLYDVKNISKWHLIIYTAGTLSACLLFIPLLKSIQINNNYISYGYGCFLLIYLSKELMILPRWTLLVSEVTYAVYLFHDWLLDKIVLVALPHRLPHGITMFISTLFMFSFCGLMTYLIEKPAIRIGRALALKLQSIGWKDC